MVKSVFKVNKLLFYSPKKDQCDVYMSYKAWKVSKEDYQPHQEKNSVQHLKNQDVLECHQTHKTVLKTYRRW